MKFNEQIRPICLANFELQNDKIVHLAGWGLTQGQDINLLKTNIFIFIEMDYKGATPIPEENRILQESTAKIIDDEECLSIAIKDIEEDYEEGMSEEKFQAIAKIKEEMSQFRYCLQGLDNSHTQKVNIINTFRINFNFYLLRVIAAVQ